MRVVFVLALCLFGAVFAAEPVAAQDVVKPDRGSALRTELLDAARPVFERETGGPVEFVVRQLNVLDVWAFGNVTLQRPGGGAIDWSRTKFGQDEAEGMFEADGHFFLLRRADSGEWMPVEYALGPTDVAWDWWRQQLDLPEKLFLD